MSDTAVLITRPGEAGEQLAGSLSQTASFKDHGSAWHAPTLAIEALPLSQNINQYHKIIFISPNAVTFSVGRSNKTKDEFLALDCELFAVGAGTAKQLTDRGVTQVIVPQQFSSEGLLNLPQLNSVHNLKILIVKGRGGRPLLHETLIQRGAECDLLDVYARHACDIENELWQKFWRYKKRWVTVASVEALESFDRQRLADQRPLPEKIFTASNRIAERARALGYTAVILAQGAANADFINAVGQELS